MNGLVNRLDTKRLLIALKTCLALVLGFAITLQLDWKPAFMAITIVVLQADALGVTLKKGLLYIAGTLGGAIAGVAMVGLFAHDRGLFILGMALLTGYGVYRMQGSRYPYAWLIFIVTSALIGWLPAQAPGSAFELAVMRASTVCLGVIVVFSVHGILWPFNAGKMFERQLQQCIEGCRDLLLFARQAAAGEAPDAETVKQAAAAQVRMVTALRRMLLRGAATEEQRSHRRRTPDIFVLSCKRWKSSWKNSLETLRVRVTGLRWLVKRMCMPCRRQACLPRPVTR